jgi:hypothetical protein
MAKKGVKKAAEKPMSQRQIQIVLVENFVKMQHVLANLSVKFDLLSDNISKMMQLIEISAKTFVEKQQLEKEVLTHGDKDLLEKLDLLMDQNKTIAKGLTLVEEKLRHKLYGETILPSGIHSSPMHQIRHHIAPAGKADMEEEKPTSRPLPRL